MKLQDFLKTDILGNKFIAIKSYEPVYNKDTNELEAYRLNISLQDETSPVFMELITVKIKNIAPTLSVHQLSENKAREVKLKGLKVGYISKSNVLYFTAEDVLPIEKG